MSHEHELIIDSFAGGGGASLGIEWATGRSPDIAINHDREALIMHAQNHPHTEHVLEDVWRADLRALTKGRAVGLLWASPDCKHFSRAKGAKPVEKKIRSLAWIVTKWAQQIQPRVICLENVREFADWGPLIPRWKCRECDWRGTEGQTELVRTRRKCPRCESRKLIITEELIPDPARKGLTFRRFVGRLQSLGYVVEYRNLNAAEYGAPTNRRRLFLIARCDGEPITWPEPTHGEITRTTNNRRRNSSESTLRKNGTTPLQPVRSAADCIDWTIECPSIFERKRALAEKTLRRIAHGIKRYVIDSECPFLVPVGYGERAGQSPRTGDLFEPLDTVVQTSKHCLVSPILSKYHGSKSAGDDRCQQLELPFNTLDTQPRFALIAPSLVSVAHGDGKTGTWSNAKRANDIDQPMPTATRTGNQALCAAFLAKHFGGVVGVPVTQPTPTTTMRGTQTQLVAANLVHLNHGKSWSAVDEPGRTQTTANHAALVYSFLVKYFGTAIGSDLSEPLPTVTSKDRCGLVTVTIQGEPYVIVDIGMRMLTPRELARAQGFPDSYQLTGTKTSQVARIGNSVCPPIARAIVAANFVPQECEVTS